MTTAAMQRLSGAEWRIRAADVVARFPLAGTDWDQHRDCIESGFYSLQNCTGIAVPAAAPDCEYAEPPLSPDEEEQLATLF